MVARANRQPPNTNIKVAEFFAGIGLVRLAMEQAGFQVVFANDIDPDKEEMYRANFDGEEFVLGDVHYVRPEQIPDCQVFTASFPCNDLSIAGAMRGLKGSQSGAYWGLIRLLEGLGERRPDVVLLENVPGFLQTNAGEDFAAALSALNGLGYVCDALMVDAERFVPQSRLRMFVMAFSGESPTDTFGLQPSPTRPEALVRFIHAHPDIEWRIAPEKPLPKRATTLADVVEPLSDDDPAWWNRDRAEYFMNQLSARHREVAEAMICGSRITYGTAFRRVRRGRSMAELRTDGVAGCLRTPRGGSGRQILFKAGRGRYQVRLLTARECARLQGAPDDFQINVGLNQALFGFGDAVCVPVVRWIAENYLRPVFARPGRRRRSPLMAD